MSDDMCNQFCIKDRKGVMMRYILRKDDVIRGMYVDGPVKESQEVTPLFTLPPPARRAKRKSEGYFYKATC